MKTLADEIVLAIIIAAVSLASCIDCTAIPAEAQSIPARLAAGGHTSSRPREPQAVTLTRLLVAEVDAHEADLAPVLAVLQTRADRVGSTPGAVGLLYARIYRSRRPSPRMFEIRRMPGEMSAPRAEQWARARAAVDRWLAGDHRHGCSATPSHFGDRHGDMARALRMRWVEVMCPGALGWYGRER